jgi:hypothetical protein
LLSVAHAMGYCCDMMKHNVEETYGDLLDEPERIRRTTTDNASRADPGAERRAGDARVLRDDLDRAPVRKLKLDPLAKLRSQGRGRATRSS